LFLDSANKQLSATAAAARALDCFAFRVNMQNKSIQDDAPLCLDAPYLANSGPRVPDCFQGKLPVTTVVADQNSGDVAVAKNKVNANHTEESELHSKLNPPTPNPNTIAVKVDDSSKTSQSQTNTDTNSTGKPKAAKSNETKVIKSPKQLLNEYYAKLHIKTDKDNYTTIKHDKVQVVKFASTFTCPKTDEKFAGGRLKDTIYSEEDGVVWYANIKLATTAAAARAIDCFIFRERTETSTDEIPQYCCLDAPYLKGSSNLPNCFNDKYPIKSEKKQNETTMVKEGWDSVDEDEISPMNNRLDDQKIVQQQQCKVESSVEPQLNSNTKIVSNKTSTASKPVPKQELNHYYSKQVESNQISQIKNYYTVWTQQFTKTVRYTCIFTCPVTLESFASGHIQERDEGAILHEACFWYSE
jgi:hypothetical protein